MSGLAAVQQAITELSEAEYARLLEWLNEFYWERWDKQFEADVEAGKLDFLAEEALEAKERGTLRDL